MKKNITLLVLNLLLIVSGVQAQKLDYENTSKWFWGLNVGATWQNTDVQNQTNGGWGFVLGRAFNYDYGKRLSFDLRGRYLGGYWYGQDGDSTDFTYANDALSKDPTNYKDSLGYMVNNFRNNAHEMDLELVLHMNRLREQTGWDPYIFGGVGLTWYQPTGDLLNRSAFDNSMYDYDNLLAFDADAIDAFRDGHYESDLDRQDAEYSITNDASGYKVGFMPSVGIGIGYYMGKRFSMGLEHKTTFALADDFDGYINPTGKRENDIYHYTSAYFRYHFKWRQPSVAPVNTNTTQNNNFNSGCQTPMIAFRSPTRSNTTVDNPNFNFTADIAHVRERSNIMITVNGVQTTNFVMNFQTNRLEGSAYLQQGSNTIVISATNTCGTVNQSMTVNYTPNCDDPIILVRNPNQSGLTVESNIFVLDASIYNLTTSSSVTVRLNGRLVNDYSLVGNQLVATLNLQDGANSIEIIAANSCGTVSEYVTINTEKDCELPKIQMIAPAHEITIDVNTYTVEALISNIGNLNQIELLINGIRKAGGNFNKQTGKFTRMLLLSPGRNTIEIKATNECGTVSHLVHINVMEETVVINPPVISVSSICNATIDPGMQYITGNITNVNSLSQVSFEVNGAALSNINPQFVNGGLNFGFNINATSGTYTIVITATNEGGTDVHTCILTVNEPIVEDRITICHYPPGNTGNPQTIEIPLSAWPAHQAHGDKLGPCPEFEDPVEEEKITICHYPPGNHGNPQTIEIPLSAWPAHQAHGDKLGPCPEVEDPVEEEKITICHYPPGNNGNPQTIEIPLSAWPAHQRHGDKLGPCPVDDEPVEEEKITICHYPPGNNGNPQTIEIPLSAWPAHQKHGDKLGPCPEVTDPVDTEEEKVTICHYPPGNNGNPQTIEIPLSAWPAHQRHGDKLGPCPEVTEPEDVEEEKITICHYPPGNNGNPQTIQIPLSAWPAHQAHGDKLGPCPEVTEPVDTEEEKITICHYPPGNNGNPQTIEIPLSAWPAHQAHGDKLGPCPEVEEPTEVEMVKICIKRGKEWETLEVPLDEWPKYQKQGAKLGPCTGAEEKPRGNREINQGGGNRPGNGDGASGDNTGMQNSGLNTSTNTDLISNQQEEAARQKAEAERKAREEQQRKAEEQARQKAEQERIRKQQEEAARQKAEAERKAREEQQRKAEDQARQKAEQERIRKQQEEAARQKAEAERKAREEQQRKAEEQARQKAEQERIRKQQEEAARQKAEQERIRKQQEEAARQKAEAERKAKAEAERKAQEAKKKKEEAEKKRQELESKSKENGKSEGRN